LPDEVIAKKIQQSGWVLGVGNKDDQCPACATRRPLKLVSDTAPKADPPREPSRDDLRIIFEKLSETYVDDKTGYSPGWSDNRVAHDLGVPRAWVSRVRDEMFGPIGTNPEMQHFLQEAEVLLQDARAALASAKVIREQAEVALNNLRRELSGSASFEDRLSKIERLAQEVRKQGAL